MTTTSRSNPSAAPSADAFVAHLGTVRASAILRTDRADVAAAAMDAAVRGGFRIIEFTLTTPKALELIGTYAARGDLTVGAGTVLTVEQAEAAVRAGAQFLVSPVLDEAVIATALDLGVAVMPGTFTATEMLRAHRAGAHLCKLFPGPAGGPAYVRSILAPLPFLRIVPTNGVTLENAAQFLEAGAHAVGFTTALFDPAALAAGQVEEVEARAARLLEAVAAAPTR